MRATLAPLAFALCALFGAPLHAREVAEAPFVEFSTGFAMPLQVDATLLDTLPKTTLDADDHGTPGRWSGARFVDVLRKAGAPLGEALRGPNLSKYVLVTAADGYRVVFSLSELDPALGNTMAILAVSRDDKPLPEKEAPYRIVVAGDDRPARWIRQVVKVELLDAPGTPAAPPSH